MEYTVYTLIGGLLGWYFYIAWTLGPIDARSTNWRNEK